MDDKCQLLVKFSISVFHYLRLILNRARTQKKAFNFGFLANFIQKLLFDVEILLFALFVVNFAAKVTGYLDAGHF